MHGLEIQTILYDLET